MPLRKNREEQFDFEEEHSAKKKETTRYSTLALEQKILKTSITWARKICLFVSRLFTS